MNILLINHYAGSLRHGMEYRPYYLAREWVKAGHDVTIIAASFSHLRSKNPMVTRYISEEIIHGIRYIWLFTPTYKGNGIGRIRNMLSFIIRLRSYLQIQINKVKYDAVIASSTYPLDIYPASMVQKRTGAKFIFEVHDLWPLSPMELGNIPPWHPYIMLMQKAENDAYRFCDRVVSLLPCAEEHMLRHGLARGKFVALPNGIDVSGWPILQGDLPAEHQEVFQRLREKKTFVAGYAGAHGVANSLHTLLEAGELLKGENVALVFVGQGPEKENLQRQARVKGLKSVFFLPAVDKMMIPVVLGFFDVAYIGLQNQPLFRFGVSPNKLMDYMMAAKPIVHAIKAGNDLVRDAECGISVEPEDPRAVANAIMNLMAMGESERIKMGLRGRQYVLACHDYKVLATKFLEIMK